MKLKPRSPGEHRYAVAVREGTALWLTLWVRRSPNGEFFIMMPRGDRKWAAHTSYHRNGKLHLKSYGKRVVSVKRQPLTKAFRGAEHLGVYTGHAPKKVGVVCDPTAFSGVVELLPDALGQVCWGVTVDLVEPNQKPAAFAWTRVIRRQVFRDIVPWVVITVGVQDDVSQPPSDRGVS